MESGYTETNSVFFYSSSADSAGLNIVEPKIFENGSKESRRKAREFLEGLGVLEYDKVEALRLFLDKNYGEENNWNPNKEHIKIILQNFREDKEKVAELCANYKIFIAKGSDGDNYHVAGRKCIIDEPLQKTYLKTLYSKNPDFYTIDYDYYNQFNKREKDLFIELAIACGAKNELKIMRDYIRRASNPNWHELKRGWARRTHHEINYDYDIKELDDAFTNGLNFETGILVWKTMEASSKAVLYATYRPNASENTRRASSALVEKLKVNKWVPTKTGELVLPREATPKNLHKSCDLNPEWLWLKEIEFGLQGEKEKIVKEQQEKVLRELGVTASDLKLAQQISKHPSLKKKINSVILEKDFQNDLGIDPGEIKNSSLRKKRVSEEAEEAPDDFFEKKERSIPSSINLLTKESAGQYLVNEYMNDQGQLLCQACNKQVPFNLNDGSPYFERVKFVSNLKKLYRYNFLCLCPNHSAMFRYAKKLHNNELIRLVCNVSTEYPVIELEMGQVLQKVHFTKKHIQDLQIILKSEGHI